MREYVPVSGAHKEASCTVTDTTTASESQRLSFKDLL